MKRYIENIEQGCNLIVIEINVILKKLNEKLMKKKLAEIEMHTKKCRHCSKILDSFLDFKNALCVPYLF